MLPNQLQCWKAGEEEVTELSLGNPNDVYHVYQLCERHVRIQQAIDAGTLSEDQVNTVYKEQTVATPAPVPVPTPETILSSTQDKAEEIKEKGSDKVKEEAKEKEHPDHTLPPTKPEKPEAPDKPEHLPERPKPTPPIASPPPRPPIPTNPIAIPPQQKPEPKK